MLLSGVSEKVITPDFPTYLAGYPQPKDRYHNDVHDDIMAHCFYLKNKRDCLVIVTLDLCYYTKSRVRKVREQIREACGIPEANIMISATHTHSAPVPAGIPFRLWNEEREMYPHYLDFVNQQIVEGVREAMMNAFSAEIAMGHGICGKEQNVGGNRRSKDGPADPEVWVTAIRDDEKKLRGVLVNYALHPTFLHAENLSITADYPGYIASYFKEKDPDLVVGFQMGAAGDQSSRHFRSGQTFDEAKRVGFALAAEAERVINRLDFDPDPNLIVRHADLMPKLKPIPTLEEAAADRRAAEQALEEARRNNEPYPVLRTLECALIGADRRLEIAKAGKAAYIGYQALFPFDIMVAGIGSGRMVAVPCEIFVEFGLRLKKESPFEKTYLAATSNGASSGYLYTPESYEEGGYEPLVSIYAPEAGDQVIDTALSLLKEDDFG